MWPVPRTGSFMRLPRNQSPMSPMGMNLQAEQVHVSPGGQRPGAVWRDREAVALTERAGHVRALALGRPGDEDAVVVRDELGDQERRAVVGRAGGVAQAAALEARARVGLAAQPPQGGHDEDRGPDDRRQRVARKAE